MPDKAATIWRCVWIFGVLGPFFGYATAISLLVIGESDSVFDVLMLPFAIVLTSPVGFPMAWLVGLLPAILTGITYWALRAKAAVRVPAAVALSAITAGILCVVNMAIVFGESTSLLDGDAWRLMFVPAIVAILFCAAVIEGGSRKAPARQVYE